MASKMFEIYRNRPIDPFEQSQRLDLYSYLSVNRFLKKMRKYTQNLVSEIQKTKQISNILLSTEIDSEEKLEAEFGDVFSALEDPRDCSFRSTWNLRIAITLLQE